MTAKTFFTTLALVITMAFFVSCNRVTGSGNIERNSRSVAGFTGISVSGPVEVEISTGDKYEVIVEADDNLIDDISTRVNNRTLKISVDKKNIRNGHLAVYITAPELRNIRASSAASVKVDGVLKSASEIRLMASSAGNIKGIVDAPVIEADCSSGSEIEISGRTRDFRAQSSSAGNIEAAALNAERTDVSASSGGSAEVHASVDLSAKASSGGTVNYRGGASVRQSTSSGGEVRRID